MTDNVASDPRRREALRLVRIFLGITDPGKRRRILELAERLADDVAAEATELALASTDASPGESCRDIPGQTE